MRDRDRPATWGRVRRLRRTAKASGPHLRKSGSSPSGRCNGPPQGLVCPPPGLESPGPSCRPSGTARGRGGKRGEGAQHIAARGAPRGCPCLSRTRPLGAPRFPHGSRHSRSLERRGVRAWREQKSEARNQKSEIRASKRHFRFPVFGFWFLRANARLRRGGADRRGRIDGAGMEEGHGHIGADAGVAAANPT